jgi:hypothetical protein
VVTFEPDRRQPPSSSTSHTSAIPPPPSLHGIRSRVVNAKRTDLSKGVRRKVMKDNCELFTGNLRGWKRVAAAAATTTTSPATTNDGEDNAISSSRSNGLVKGFFGHTRFATSSKASFDGTHPHIWSPRKMYHVYPFASASASSAAAAASVRSPQSSLRGRAVGVENYITHNGDFEFFHVNGKFYDVEVVQHWLEKVLDVPMPATVDSGE